MSQAERDEQIAGSIGDQADTADAGAEATAADSAETGAEADPLQQALQERDAAHERWLRGQAELDNFRKRMHRERDDERRYREIDLVRDLLPGLDNLRRAVEAAMAAGQKDELSQGVELVLRQFEEILAGHQAQAIEAVGQPFDPNLHEALQQVPTSDYPPMTVVQEVQKGYTLHDRVVRPSQVIVSAAMPAESTGGDSEPAQ